MYTGAVIRRQKRSEKVSIKNIVFDMGNVLTVFDAREYIYGYVDNEEDYRILRNELCGSVEWLMMDRGTLTDEEAIERVSYRVPEHLRETVARFVREYRMEQPANPPMEKLVKELSDEGYKLYLMSNTSHRFRVFCERIKSIDYMTGVWISCEHGLLKPQTESFQNFFQCFDLKPEECFFIDDTPANIEAAMCQGMDGCVYHGQVEELRTVLRAKKILPGVRS